jgi:hypothetical protein
MFIHPVVLFYVLLFSISRGEAGNIEQIQRRYSLPVPQLILQTVFTTNFTVCETCVYYLNYKKNIIMASGRVKFFPKRFPIRRKRKTVDIW